MELKGLFASKKLGLKVIDALSKLDKNLNGDVSLFRSAFVRAKDPGQEQPQVRIERNISLNRLQQLVEDDDVIKIDLPEFLKLSALAQPA